MRIVKDVVYGDTPRQKLDIYTPQDASGAPVLIDIHGGAWRMGSKNGRGHLADVLTVEKEIVWIPIDYGLAPEFGMDAIVGHTRKAVAWVWRNIADYGGDPTRIFVSGNSSGGQLAAAMVIPGWPQAYGLPGDVVKGVCAMSGVYDLTYMVGGAWGGPNDELKMDMETARRNSPIHNIPKTPIPLIIAVGGAEVTYMRFRALAYDFAAAWRAAGHEPQLFEVPERHHFDMARMIAQTDSELHAALMRMISI
jgi:arylformamidase